jgi:lipopolysaccharide/colanic/teichoic acid biosynthesis glycosyltransferase
MASCVPTRHKDKRDLAFGFLAKEILERVATVFLLLALSPVFAAIAVAVRRTSPGPVIYRQTRLGYFGQPFVLHKFRTMRWECELEQEDLCSLNEADGPLFKIRCDPRITPLGWWLRRLSLDELPQLWNVLRGQMGLVGPRPSLPTEAAQYEDAMYRRFLMKPGLTGNWQVNGRATLPWSESVRLDLDYVDNWSLGLDLVLLAKTPVAIIRGEGAF